MDNNELTNNTIRVYTTSAPGGLTVSASRIQQTLGVTNNKAREYAEAAKKYRDETKDLRDDAKYYAEQNADVTMGYVNEMEARLQRGIDSKQASGDYALNSAIPTNISSLTNDSQYVNTTQLGTAIDSVRLPEQTGHDGEFLYTNGESPSWKGVNELCLFDYIEKDHVLTYQESKGYVQIGEYVYKEALAGSHYGYPDFYDKCLEEYNDSNNTLEILKNNYTVVGSPTITNDGIASGFSSSNYVKSPVIDLRGKKWKIECAFTTGNDITTGVQIPWSLSHFGYYNSLGTYLTNGALALTCNVGGTTLGQSYAVNANTSYCTSIEFTGSKYIFKLDDTTPVEFDNSSEVSNLDATTYFTAGININGNGAIHSGVIGFNGSIDLKQFSITVDGIPVLTGNQTGIDTIKPDDFYAPSGGSLPTISADGVASGFTDLKMIYKDVDLDNKSFVIETPIYHYTQVESSTAQWMINLGTYNNKLYLQARILSTGKISTGIRNDTTDLVTDANTDAVLGNKYQIKFVLNTSVAEIYLKTNNNNYVLIQSVANANLYTLNDNSMSIGNAYKGATSPFLGNVDLNACKIYADGDLVYQPCLKIPYTLSNTGSKVVDVAYRDRVSDMYEQYGYTPYYMSDEYHEITTYNAIDCARINPNGHKYYDISNKPEIDTIYNNTGLAWYYGIDVVNKRVLLPRMSNLTSGRYLYIVVGNTFDWTGITDVVGQGISILGQVNASLLSKVNTDMTNISSAGKSSIIDMLMPDYSSGIVTTNNSYTAPSNGLAIFHISGNSANGDIYINGSVITHIGDNYGGVTASLPLYVQKDDVLSITVTYGVTSETKITFYPLKGVN